MATSLAVKSIFRHVARPVAMAPLLLESKQVLDLDRISLEIQCPGCNFYEQATLKQTRLQDVIICGGCKANIHLQDHMAEVAKARLRIQRQLGELAEILAKPININIRL